MKKIKLFLSILTTLAILTSIICIWFIVIRSSENAEEKYRQDYIADLIAEEVDNEKKPIIDIDSIVNDSIVDSTVQNQFSNINMISASTFKATLNGEEKIYRLIGVSEIGNKDNIQVLLSSIQNVVIKYDYQKKKDGVYQIYLWDTTDNIVSDMINIRIVKEGFANTTYDGTGYSEHPNVTYSTQFIEANKKKENH